MILLSKIRRIYETACYRSACHKVAFKGNSRRPNQEWINTPHADRWAHAGGGRFHLYGNSQEAFDDAIASGFSILEADVMMTADNVPVMSHRFRPNFSIEFDKTPTAAEFLAHKINGKYTPMTLEAFIARYSERDVYIAIDPSPSLREKYGSDYILRYLQARTSVDFQRKVIYQISGVQNLHKYINIDWLGALHYNLSFDISSRGSAWRVNALIPALKAVGVGSVSYVDQPVTPILEDAVDKFTKAGIIVSVASVNTIDRFKRLELIGAKCIDTDYLYP